jgi:hypothetical protein
MKIHPLGDTFFHANKQMELIRAFHSFVNAPKKIGGLPFINAPNTATLTLRKPAAARTSQDSCSVQDSNKINTVDNTTTSILFTL